MLDKLLVLLLLKMILIALGELKLLVEIKRQVLYLLNFGPHLDLHHHQLVLKDIQSCSLRSVAIEVLEAVAELTVLHIVECIHPRLKLSHYDVFLSQECFRC
jgi:hypothetical protein